MPQNYYTFPDTTYPPLALSVVERLKIYTFQKVYPSVDTSLLDTRFFITDMTSEMALRQGVQGSDLTNATFPFSVYNIGEWEEFDDYQNYAAKSKRYFSSIHNTMIYARPIVLNIPMITFFHTPLDFDRARTILMEQNATKNILDVPITINSVLTSTPVKLTMEIGRGSYAWEWAQHLVAGNIWDLVHNFKALYYEIVTDAGPVAPVDDILFSLGLLETKNQEDKIWIARNVLSPDTPEITVTSPVDGATDVLVDTSIIITFNEPMVEQSVEDALVLDPIIDADLIWNSTSTQLAIDPVNDMQNNTEYTITIEDTAISGEDIPLEEDYSFSFTTISS